MNNQKIYDTVARHLLTQNEPAMLDSGECAYRNARGLKCAIGCLIPDELYRPEFDEGFTVHSLLAEHELARLWETDGSERDSDFLTELQMLHDYHPAESWPESLKKFAIENGLEPVEQP